MLNALRTCAAAACLLAAAPLRAEGDRANLVQAGWLQQRLGRPEVLVLDASPAPAYAAEHIPGAVHHDLLTYGIQELPTAVLQQRYQSLGISPDKQLVLYDQGGSMMATRLFFDLYYHGFPVRNLLLLDGGLAKWKQAGLPVVKDATPAPAKGSFRIAALREEARSRLPEVLAASAEGANPVLLEALGANWHFGEVVAFDRPGHIPRGILLPSADFYNPDKTFKSPEELQRMLAYLGVRKDQEILTYCGGGVAASVPFFALRFLLGYPQVRLYKESEMGWLQDERGLPYWSYDAPYLMRNAGWVQAWGGRMLRMYAGARISLVDVRPAEAFQQGHLPFALSIPVETFRAGLRDPARLAGILGPAGLDSAQEAVVVSGAGLSRDAALAFLALELLGQKKVSVYLDPAESWTQRGFAITKDPTAVGPKKSLQDLSIPPAVHAAQLRQGLVVADPAATHGLYPKVFLAAGTVPPARKLEGKVVHLPCAQLLNADGTPKPAKELWNLLSKAGVPRYAELVCVADDPGEAATAYFILKLMGWPDLKVLLP